MAITLADAMENAATDVDYAVIDEFRKADWFIDSVTFDDAATPGTGGATTSYGYTRLTQERAAGVRDYNTEGPQGEAKRTKVNVDLVPLNASYTLDRVLAHLGQRATDEVALQTAQAQKAVRARFTDALINGARQTDSNGFDGLDAALAGSSTELSADAVVDWSGITAGDSAHDAIDLLDELLGLLDGEPSAIVGNGKAIRKLRAIGRRADYYEKSRDEFGRNVETFAGVPFRDLGAKDGSSQTIIPSNETRTVNAVSESGLTDLYVVRMGLDGLHGVSVSGAPLLQTFLPDFTTAGAVKPGEVEMGPVALALKSTKAAAVLRNVRV